MAVSASDVKNLRERTGAAMMDCKAALDEAEGDADKAIEILRVKGQASAAKRSGKATSEGVVSSYIHAGGKVGVLVEIQCETDFVARTDDFQEFAREIAIHIAATAPLYVSAEDIPADQVEAERAVFAAKAREEGKPDNVVEKIVEGQSRSGRRTLLFSTRSTCVTTATTARRSSRSAPRSPPTPARTCGSPASPGSQ